MGTITWTYDVPGGPLKSNFLSRTLLAAAYAQQIFGDYIEVVRGYGRKKGETVTIPRDHVIAEPVSAVLSEQTRIPEVAYQLSAASITVQEFGQAITHTSLLDMLSSIDWSSRAQRALMNQQRLTMDTVYATAFRSAKVCYIPTGIASGVFDTDGTPSTQATANMNVFHLETIRDYLFDTLKAPPYAGGDYMAVGRTKAVRGIKRDPTWEEWMKYTTPEAKATFEIGRIENVRIAVTNHAEALAEVGASAVLGEMFVFGADAVVMAEVEAPEIRVETNKGQDYGRLQGAAWYGVLGVGAPWADTANSGEARIVRVTSS